MIFQDFIDLFFPNPCFVCSQKMGSAETYICTSCQLDLPYAREYNDPENAESNKLFWGKLEIKQVYTGFYFKKGNPVQNLMHELKYNHQPKLGVEMGIWLAREMIQYNQPLPDVIIPVPLHPKRQRTRGYNQSHQLALGISKTLNIPINHKTVKRVAYNVSQTKQTRFTRWDNVEKIFNIEKRHQLHGKHLLIVDDVITTGSTLEALCNEIQKSFNCTISIASFAVTKL